MERMSMIGVLGRASLMLCVRFKDEHVQLRGLQDVGKFCGKMEALARNLCVGRWNDIRRRMGVGLEREIAGRCVKIVNSEVYVGV